MLTSLQQNILIKQNSVVIITPTVRDFEKLACMQSLFIERQDLSMFRHFWQEHLFSGTFKR
jgi:hypothetical protein